MDVEKVPVGGFFYFRVASGDDVLPGRRPRTRVTFVSADVQGRTSVASAGCARTTKVTKTIRACAFTLPVPSLPRSPQRVSRRGILPLRVDVRDPSRARSGRSSSRSALGSA